MSPAVGLSGRVVQPKTQRGKRALLRREPKPVENPKQALVVRGQRTGPVMHDLLKDLYSIRKPLATMLQRSNEVLPFEDDTFFEKMCRKYDSSLFCLGNHNKKRPNNLTIGRMYDFHTLDMVEMGVTDYKSIKSLKSARCIPLGTKPCLAFSGDAFQSDPLYARLKNLLIDFFRGEQPDRVRLQGLQLLVQVTALPNGALAFRTYRIDLKKSGLRTPRCELVEMGPSFNATLRRHRIANDDLYKTACKVPKEVQVRKVKNVSKDVFGTTHGRVHVGKQDLSQLRTRRMKALKNRPAKDDGDAAVGEKRLNDSVAEKGRGRKRLRTE